MIRKAVLIPILLSAAARAETVTVPVDVGVGPAAYFFFGPVHEDQWKNPGPWERVHWGIKINAEGVIDKKLIEANKHRIPPKYQKQARNVNEVRYRPSIFIPDALIISPKIRDTGIYGITWRPFGVGITLIPRRGATGLDVDLDAGLLFTAAYIHSDTLGNTLFLRPGIDVMLEAEVLATTQFGFSLGWASAFYIPQELGGFGLGSEPLRTSIFHVGQAFFKLHFRFPYNARL